MTDYTKSDLVAWVNEQIAATEASRPVELGDVETRRAAALAAVNAQYDTEKASLVAKYADEDAANKARVAILSLIPDGASVPTQAA
jgi:hypothetical protein